MAATMLDELLEAWRYTRDGVIAEVANLPASRVAERPDGLGRSALELVEHIVVSGRLMAGELSRRDGDFCRASYDALIEEHAQATDRAASHTAAIELLRSSHAHDAARLRDAGMALMQQRIRQFSGAYASRLAWMHHGIAHEEYHRGQPALYARLFGGTPALTRQILGE
jgi:uncharacterized damage-inducible protein DinB